jgi:hypothetical protein
LACLRDDPSGDGRERSQIVVRQLAGGAERVIVDQTKQLATRPEWNPVEPVPAP